MNKDSFSLPSQENYKYINLGFFRCDPITYKNSLIENPFSAIDKNDFKTKGIEYRNLLSWGYADVLTIFLFNDANSFLEFQKIHPSNNKIYEDRYNCGLVIQPKDFSLSKTDDLPLVGISFIKFDDKLFQGIKYGQLLKLLKEHIWVTIQDLTKQNKDILPVLIFSYGWEDIILLVFAKRYDVIKELIFKMRTSLTYFNIQSYLNDDFFTQFPKARHTIATTYTTFATCLSFLPYDNIDETLNKLLCKIDQQDETLGEQINFQIRPGHSAWVIEAIRTMDKEVDKKADFRFLPGRQDFSLKFKNMKVRDIFEFYFKSIWPILASKESPIISTQTLFALKEKKMEDNIPCDNPVGFCSLPDSKRQFVEDITKTTYLPYHSAIALGNILVSAWYLENNFFKKGIMKSLIKFITTMEERLANDKGRYDIAVQEILPLLSLCFIDRFRGSYPLGESFATPLITCKGSIQKQLVFMDYTCQLLFNTIRECLNAQGKNIEEYYFCSTIGTITSPAIVPFNREDEKQNYYNLAILQIPLDSIFSPKDLYYLFHEIGHVIITHLKLGEYIESKLFEFSKGTFFLPENKTEFANKIDDFIATEKLIEDILCDYILLIFGFGGDTKELKKFMAYYDEKLHRGSISYEIIFRTLSAEVLCLYLDDETRLLSEFQTRGAILNSLYKCTSLTTNFICQEISQKSDLFVFLKNIRDFLTTKNNNKFYLELKKFPFSSLEDWLEIYRTGS